MKTYPSIPGPSKAGNTNCVGFVKYDGSNLRFEWIPKRGWHKFGSRRQLISKDDKIYGKGIDIFLEKYADKLEKTFLKVPTYANAKSITCFGEFFGASSLAGMHRPDDEFDVVLFDVNLHKKGMMNPYEFSLFCMAAEVKGAEIKYRGGLNQEVINSVRDGTMNVQSDYDIRSNIPEGLIFKGGTGHSQWAIKVKTNEYKEALKEHYQSNWIKYWE